MESYKEKKIDIREDKILVVLQVSSYGDQSIKYNVSEVNIADHHNVILSEQSQLHQIHNCLAVSMCSLVQIIYKPDNGEQDNTTIDHVN